jgi:hypothetical protein
MQTQKCKQQALLSSRERIAAWCARLMAPLLPAILPYPMPCVTSACRSHIQGRKVGPCYCCAHALRSRACVRHCLPLGNPAAHHSHVLAVAQHAIQTPQPKQQFRLRPKAGRGHGSRVLLVLLHATSASSAGLLRRLRLAGASCVCSAARSRLLIGQRKRLCCSKGGCSTISKSTTGYCRADCVYPLGEQLEKRRQ